MEFADVVRKRRMVRHFTPEPVPLETVERMVRTAQHAPSAGFSQGVSYILVTDPETRRQVGRVSGDEEYAQGGFHPFVSEAPVQIVVCTSEKAYRDRYSEPDKLGPNGEQIEWPVPYWHTDAGAAMMLLLLAAVDEGLQTAFVGTPDPKGLRGVLDIPDDVEPVGVVMIGHGAQDVPSASLKRGRRPLDTVLHRDRW